MSDKAACPRCPELERSLQAFRTDRDLHAAAALSLRGELEEARRALDAAREALEEARRERDALRAALQEIAG